MKIRELKKYEIKLRAKLLEGENGRIASQVEKVGRKTEHDPIDLAREESDRDVSIQLVNNQFAKRSAIFAALQRIQEGIFGFCIQCDEEISEVRLDAIPEAALCITCQQRLECSQKTDLHGGEELSFV